jgi:hypothetical protein
MVIAGLDPAIHEATPRAQPQGNTARNLIMDARVKPAHDESKIGADGISRPLREACKTWAVISGSKKKSC